uniref:HECT domain-containing protein n=1 Tax=Bursaphelenchus xylophilus TaxID=6326 RepID=A0A1I7RLT4_BURXY
MIDFLSPSLFSLHDEGEGIENLTSIPQLMRGFEVKDQQMWLDFILEAAGVTDRTNDLENHIEDDDNIVLGNLANQTDISKFRREDGHPLYFTKDNLTDLGGTEYEKQKVEYYQEFLKTMSKKQGEDRASSANPMALRSR